MDSSSRVSYVRWAVSISAETVGGNVDARLMPYCGVSQFCDLHVTTKISQALRLRTGTGGGTCYT